MLLKENAALVLVDVQSKLFRVMHKKESLLENVQKIIKGAQILEIPILWAEQNPRGLGHTVPEIAQLLLDISPMSKISFSCCGDGRFMEALSGLSRKQILIAGIETHVCVYQTAADLLNLGYDVQVVVDAVSSRTEDNNKVGLEKIKDAGAALTSVETALFELLKVAEGDRFKAILKIVK